MRKEQEIRLLKNNDNRQWSDVEWIREFHDFLQGTLPKEMNMSDKPQLTPEVANNIIWYLQEHLSVFPDHIEMCSDCKKMYDSYSEGWRPENSEVNYCGWCAQYHEDDEEKGGKNG